MMGFHTPIIFGAKQVPAIQGEFVHEVSSTAGASSYSWTTQPLGNEPNPALGQFSRHFILFSAPINGGNVNSVTLDGAAATQIGHVTHNGAATIGVHAIERPTGTGNGNWVMNLSASADGAGFMLYKLFNWDGIVFDNPSDITSPIDLTLNVPKNAFVIAAAVNRNRGSNSLAAGSGLTVDNNEDVDSNDWKFCASGFFPNADPALALAISSVSGNEMAGIALSFRNGG